MNTPMTGGTVTIATKGGLGNQLFIFFTGLAYAQSSNRTLLVNTAHGGRGKLYWANVLSNGLQKDNVELERKTETSFRFQEASFMYQPIPLFEKYKSVSLVGYFQSFHYFQNLEQEIVSLLSPSQSVHDQLNKVWTENLRLRPEDRDRAVAIHVRRGDYFDSKHHVIVSPRYYLAATAIFQTGTIFVVFSDDMKWCRNNFRSLVVEDSAMSVVFVPEELNEVDTFYLISTYCRRGHVIANSTFSWWIALVSWMQLNKMTKIVAPHPWFSAKGPQRYDTIYTPGWTIRNNDGDLCDASGNVLEQNC